MKNQIKVEDEKELVRDASTGAILCIDKETLNRSRQIRRKIKTEQDRIKSLEERILILEKVLMQNVRPT